MKAILVALALFLFAALPAAANTLIHVGLKSQPDAPIQINTCYAAFQDTNVGNIDYYVDEEVAFTNTSSNIATAVEFRFDMVDTFGDILGTKYGQRAGQFSPGVLIDVTKAWATGQVAYRWSTINIWEGMTGVLCSVNRVMFADGTVWSANDRRQQGSATSAPATPTPSPEPRRTAKLHKNGTKTAHPKATPMSEPTPTLTVPPTPTSGPQ